MRCTLRKGFCFVQVLAQKGIGLMKSAVVARNDQIAQGHAISDIDPGNGCATTFLTVAHETQHTGRVVDVSQYDVIISGFISPTNQFFRIDRSVA